MVSVMLLVTMPTTITLDDDVAALVEAEGARTGESFCELVNRVIRRSVRAVAPPDPPPLPELPGRPIVDVRDVSALLAALDGRRRAERGVG
jgi:hypothetical protein